MKIPKFSEKNIGVLFFITSILVLLSVTLTFYKISNSRDLFFIASYFSIVGIFFGKVNLNKNEMIFIATMAALGFSKVIWFAIAYIGNPDFDIYNSYLASGKRLIISALIATFLLSHKDHITKNYNKLIKSGLILSFFVATLVGLWQIMHHIDRVDFFQSRATGAAYMYSALSASLIFVLLKDANKKIHYFGVCLVFISAYLILFATGTRNSMICFPLALLVVGILKFHHLGWKALVITVTITLILISISYTRVIKPKMEATYQEYQIFEQTQGNDLGSLTTRLAMWKVGIQCFIAHPVGMSQEDRTRWFQNYVDTTHRDKSSLAYVNVHLHDEIIETASLQGFVGVIILILYYYYNLLVAWRTKNPALLSLIVIIITTGLTDVIFISRDQTVLFPMLMVIVYLWNNAKTQEK